MADATRDSPGSKRSGVPALVVDPHPFERAAELLVDAIRGEIEARSEVRLAIPGGSALWTAVLAKSTLGEEWQRVALTWVDERCVPIEDAESNRGAAHRSGLFDLRGSGASRRTSEPVPVRVLPLYLDGEEPETSVSRVDEGLVQEFLSGLDVVLLGMGSDGHIASLFPTKPMPDRGRVVAVTESPKPPSNRISLTRAFLATARHAILVAAGESKRDAVQRLLAGDERLPAHGLVGLTVVTDLAGVEGTRRGVETSRGERHG